jgi:hypothetical protein
VAGEATPLDSAAADSAGSDSSSTDATALDASVLDASVLDASVLDAGPSPCTRSDTVVTPDARTFVKGLTHGTAFASLTTTELSSASAASRALLDGDITTASTQAANIGYSLVPLELGAECDWLLEPTSAAPAGQGDLIVRPGWKRDLVVEAPHVPFDFDTDVEAALVFDQIGARALLVAGAARCASTTPSGCHTNTACAAYAVESDPGHSVDTAFHGFHVGMAVGPSASLSISLHANVEYCVNGDALVSNGTKLAAPGSLVEAFYTALAAPGGATVIYCNDPTTPPNAAALCGTTNAQGLATNGASPDACTGWPSAASGQFLHLEQDQVDLTSTAVDAWSARVAAALASAIPSR